jgi:hypothetical protein
MPSRRRKATGNKLTATAEPVTVREIQEESLPVVTQVVEVIEEEIPVGEPEVTASAPKEAPAPEEPEVSEKEPTAESVTRKEKVEELYQGVKESNIMPEISVHKNKPIASLLVWAIVTILVALVTGGILFAAAKKTSPITLFVRPTPTPTATPTPIPTPTPVAIDKTLFEIKVLNGGGTVGAAGKMKTFLEDKGYTVTATGNTEEYTYTSTEIHGKATMKDAIANLEADLTGTYTLGTVAADLSASASADVQVIVGK